MHRLQEITDRNRRTRKGGIYSICSSHHLVIEAAIRQGMKDSVPILIESTANQVNQFGGYSGLKPSDFIEYVCAIALKVGYDSTQIIFGGDHLGPTCWTSESSATAMTKSNELVKSYVKAGFKKIHLDTSMRCADDPLILSEQEVAHRAALLCKTAEETAIKEFGESDLLYIIGTEVPPPGGAKEDINELEVTPVENVKTTIEKHFDLFTKYSLSDAWSRVIGVVVQPGVEFDNFSVFPYSSEKAQGLTTFVESLPNIVFEAHSTDYQPCQSYHDLVRDHFAILKVGPQLTFALREALFALSFIEDQLISERKKSNLINVCREQMLKDSSAWSSFYPEKADNLTSYLHFSYSDRIRYYWNNSEIQKSIDILMQNLEALDIPLPLIRQFLPTQYDAILNRKLKVSPRALIVDHIMQVTEIYSQACLDKQH